MQAAEIDPENLPGKQPVHVEAPADEYVPAKQSVHVEAPADEYVPAKQREVAATGNRGANFGNRGDNFFLFSVQNEAPELEDLPAVQLVQAEAPVDAM